MQKREKTGRGRCLYTSLREKGGTKKKKQSVLGAQPITAAASPVDVPPEESRDSAMWLAALLSKARHCDGRAPATAPHPPMLVVSAPPLRTHVYETVAAFNCGEPVRHFVSSFSPDFITSECGSERKKNKLHEMRSPSKGK